MEALDQRACALYNCSKCYVDFEIENPVFNRVFPRARMYAVRWDLDLLPDSPRKYETMVSLGDKDYAMPYQFNQLMFDVDYELDDETLDELAHALVIAALHPLRIIQPVTCQAGKEIDEPAGIATTYRYTYEIHCHAADEDINIVAKFEAFDDQFLCVKGIAEDNPGFSFCVNQVSQEE